MQQKEYSFLLIKIPNFNEDVQLLVFSHGSTHVSPNYLKINFNYINIFLFSIFDYDYKMLID